MSERIERLFKRWKRQRDHKALWHDHWDDLARVMLPRRLGFASTTQEGERRTDDIFDGTPMQAARGLSNAIGSFMRPSGLPEVEMQADDDILNSLDEVKDWFSQSEEKLRNAFNNPKARFREVSAEFDQDLTVFGTAIKFAGESRRRDHLLFQSIHLKDATVGFNEDGMPDEFFHERNMPADWLETRFGKEKLSPQSQEKLRETPRLAGDAIWERETLPAEPGKAERDSRREDSGASRRFTSRGVPVWRVVCEEPPVC
jgi:hypothetical protein